MFVEPSTIAFGVEEAIKHRKALTRAFTKLFSLVRHGNLRIPIFGAGGTGKTTLGQFLAGKYNLGTGVDSYSESISVEKFTLQGDLVCTLLVAPGQGRRREYTWPDLYAGLAEGKSVGVINVVSWGYHSFEGIGYKETAYFQSGMKQKQFLQAYLQGGRQKELDIIKELSPRIIDAKQKVWMITLVTKQDLWWDHRKEVRDYYMDGEYNNSINAITQERGQKYFAHEYLSASLTINNFVSGTGEFLASNVAGYGENIQFAHAQKLLKAVISYAGR